MITNLTIIRSYDSKDDDDYTFYTPSISTYTIIFTRTILIIIYI